MGKDTKIIIEPPSYTQLSESDQEALLSQYGNFTPGQRTIFHTLCKFWQPEIAYKPFAEKMSLRVKNVHNEIEGLFQKLNKQKYGLLISAADEKERKREKIILTEKADPRFYRYTVEELLLEFSRQDRPVLPLRSIIQNEGLDLPAHAYTKIDLETFNKNSIAEMFKTPALLCLAVTPREDVFFISSRINQFIQMCIETIRDTTETGNVLTELARFKNTTLGELKNKIATKAPANWLYISQAVIDYNSNPAGLKKLSVSESFFTAARLVNTYLKNEIEEAKQRKAKEKELETDFKSIILQIRKNYTAPVSQQQLNELFASLKEKHPDDFEDVKAVFYEKFTKIKEQTKIPHLLFIGKQYIHRSHLQRYFEIRRLELFEELLKEFTRTMAVILKTGNRDQKSTFYSQKNFEDEIRTYIKERDEFIFDLLEHPRFLAEAIINTAKEEQNIKDLSQVRYLLENYFLPGTMRYKTLPDLFGLNMYAIFQQAFSSLSVIRQLLMKLTGKFRIQKEKYEKFKPAVSSLRERKERGERAGRHAGAVNGIETRNPVYIRQERRSRQSQKKGNVPKPLYTKKQTEQAWEEFGKSLKK